MRRIASSLALSIGTAALSCAGAPPAPPPPAPRPPASVAAPGDPPGTRVLRRSVVILSRKSGSSLTTIRPDGSVTLAYQHLENGRGPRVEGRAHLAADGTFESFEAKGVHTMGNPIEEQFRVEAGRARWKSREEQGEKALGAPAFYVPIAPLPEVTGLLYAALQRAGGKLLLLPDGEARLERTATAIVHAAGREKRLIGWSITGVDFTPVRLWTDDTGAFFGVVDNWYSCIAEGWESAIEPLVALQKELDAARDRELQSALVQPEAPRGLAFLHARVLDVEKKRWLTDQTLVVTGGKITALGPSATTRAPAGAQSVDLKGKAILPGLWDMHAHLGPADGVLNIASGVTTARDLGNDPDRLDDYKKRYDEGTAIGPRVLRSGFIEGRGDKAAGAKVTAETEAEATAAVEFYAQRQYEGIKIYNSMKPELVPVLARAAHDRGMRVSGHVPMHMRAEDAVRAGYDEIQHANMLFLNFFIDKNTDTRTPLRFSIVADNAPGFDLKSKPALDFFQLLIDKKTVVDPTLAVFEHLFVARPGQIPPSFAPMVERLPVQVQRGFRTGGLVVPGGKDQHYKLAFEKMLELVKALHDAKIPIVSGTDSIAGLMLHHELELYARAGIPIADVLAIATIDAARVMKRDKSTGSLARGKDADFFVVDGDPLLRIGDLRHVVTTVRGGAVYPSKELYESVGVRQ